MILTLSRTLIWQLDFPVDRVAEAAASGDEEAVGAVGVKREEDKRRRIHPRDLAAFLVARCHP